MCFSDRYHPKDTMLPSNLHYTKYLQSTKHFNGRSLQQKKRIVGTDYSLSLQPCPRTREHHCYQASLEASKTQCKDGTLPMGLTWGHLWRKEVPGQLSQKILLIVSFDWQTLNVYSIAGRAHSMYSAGLDSSAREANHSSPRGFVLYPHSSKNVWLQASGELGHRTLSPKATQGTNQMGGFRIPSADKDSDASTRSVDMAPTRQLRHIGTTVICPSTNMLQKKNTHMLSLSFHMLLKQGN